MRHLAASKDGKADKVNLANLKRGLFVLWRYLRKYSPETMALSGLGIVSAIGNGFIPYIAGRFFDSIITPTQYEFLSQTLPLYAWLLIAWSILQVIIYLVDWQINIKSENFSNRVWIDYWAEGVGHLLLLPVSFHKERKIGEVGEKISRAASSLETIVGRIIIDLTPQFLSIIIAISIGFFIKPFLATMLIVGVCLYSIIMMRSVAPLAGIQREYHKHLFAVFGDSYELIGNIDTVKQANAEIFEKQRMSGVLFGPVINLWNKLNRVWSNLTLSQRIIILTTQIIIFTSSIVFINQGEMTLGELLAFNAYATMVFGPFVIVGRNWQVIQNGIIQLEEAEKILATPIEKYRPENEAPIKKIKGDVTFENVDFYYDQKRPILRDISFEIKSGEVVALVGESGVGKSTLIQLVSGFQFAKKGRILIDDIPIERINLNLLRKNIGTVPQEVALFNDTIFYNIKYGSFEASDKEVRQAATEAHADKFINSFPDKWDQRVGERGVKLSVGQKQRVAIARALLRKPRILILDEPTSALDASTEAEISRSLEKLMKGKTTFIIAHRFSTVRKADKIFVFKDGRIIEFGNHQELISKSGEYKRLYDLQIGLHD